MAPISDSISVGGSRSSARLAAARAIRENKTPEKKATLVSEDIDSGRAKSTKRTKVTEKVKQTKTTVAPKALIGRCTKRQELNSSIATSFNRDPILRHLKESHKTNQSLDAEILDQIALEGLSGLTFNRLSRILDALFPTLNCVNNHESQAYIWSVIIRKYVKNPPGSNVQLFYVGPNITDSKRSHKVIYDKHIKLPHQTVERMTRADSFIYPVQDGRIMGSCSTYGTRQDISSYAIDLFCEHGAKKSLDKLDDEFKMTNLYLVAHQDLRRKAILPNWADPNVDIKLREYCTLELIGKSRTMGSVFPNDKTLGRYRIMLMSKGLITQYQRNASSPIEHHLKRFSHLLKENLLEEGVKLKGLGNADDSDDDEPTGQHSLVKICCDPNRIKVDRDTLTAVYDTICRRGGITHIKLRRRLKMPKFHIRNHLKNLISIRMVGSRAFKRAIDDNNSFVTYKAAYRTKRWVKKKSKIKAENYQGVMAKWDEVDIKAKKTLGFRRSSFTQAEDSLLIMCRITSILVNPSVSRLSWCVHKRLIRDLLHEELVESSDKTSDACLRRIKYLRRLPHNIMSINELTAELRDDPDIVRLTQSALESDDRLNKVFIQMLRVVRVKVAHLLGIGGDLSSSSKNQTRVFGPTTSNKPHIMDPKNGAISAERRINHCNNSTIININNGSSAIEISDYNSLKNFQLSKCDSVAKINQSSTFEKAKNIVDEKYNNASLVTMAFTLANRLDPIENSERERVAYKILDKFYGDYPEKLITSMFSKLNKRSILTRKNPQSTNMEQVRLQRARTRISLRLNKNVLFLLQRNRSTSLMQLVQPISQLSQIDLHESNEMPSIALLTSLCSLSSFNLNLRLKIPLNVVSIDQGNENFKTMYEKGNEKTREILSRFMSRCGQPLAASVSAGSEPSLGSLSDTLSSEFARDSQDQEQPLARASTSNNEADDAKVDDSRSALFLLRHELRSHALDKFGNLADCLVVQPCKIQFSALDLLQDSTSDLSMENFLSSQQDPKQQTNWLVKGFVERPAEAAKETAGGDNDAMNATDIVMEEGVSGEVEVPMEVTDEDITGASEAKSAAKRSPFETVKYSARLWKRLDGKVHMRTLLKLIESILSWLIVYPGIELNLLQSEFGHLMPEEHLFELLELMESSDLILSTKTIVNKPKSRLFGRAPIDRRLASKTIVTFEPTPSAYIKYAHLLALYRK